MESVIYGTERGCRSGAGEARQAAKKAGPQTRGWAQSGVAGTGQAHASLLCGAGKASSEEQVAWSLGELMLASSGLHCALSVGVWREKEPQDTNGEKHKMFSSISKL